MLAMCASNLYTYKRRNMGVSKEKLTGVGLSLSVIFGGAACGDEDHKVKEPSEVEIKAEITRLAAELKIAKVALNAGQVEYVEKLHGLPDDCEAAVSTFVPPAGELRDTELETATELIAPWCGPDNLDVVAVLRGMFVGLQGLQGEVDGLDYSLAANVAKHIEMTGATIPPSPR